MMIRHLIFFFCTQELPAAIPHTPSSFTLTLDMAQLQLVPDTVHSAHVPCLSMQVSRVKDRHHYRRKDYPMYLGYEQARIVWCCSTEFE